MLIHGSWLWRWEKHSKSVSAGEQSEWVMWVTVKVSFNITKRRPKWQVRRQSQNSAALGEFVYYQEGTHWLDTNLISSAENKSRGLGEQIWWQKGFHPACFLWLQRTLITQPEGCNSSLDCRPPSPHPLQISQEPATWFQSVSIALHSELSIPWRQLPLLIFSKGKES